MAIGAIVVAAGEGRRFGRAKALVELGGTPLVARALGPLLEAGLFCVVVAPASELEAVRDRLTGMVAPQQVVAGGASRSASVRAGLRALPAAITRVLVHDGARPLLSASLLARLLAAEGEAVVPVLPVVDALRRVRDDDVLEPAAREGLVRVQTPQVFARALLEAAHARGDDAADDAELVQNLGASIETVRGEEQNMKVTWPQDLEVAAGWLGHELRVGHGYDIHRLTEGSGLRLAGVPIAAGLRLVGHSDADVVLHAIMDACLGGAGLADIGVLFPPGEEATRGIDSALLLKDVLHGLRERGLEPLACDVTVIAEEPRIAPYRQAMRARLCELLNVAPTRLGLKATTQEGVGAIGAKEAIAAFAVVTLTTLRR